MIAGLKVLQFCGMRVAIERLVYSSKPQPLQPVQLAEGTLHRPSFHLRRAGFYYFVSALV